LHIYVVSYNYPQYPIMNVGGYMSMYV